MLIFNSEAKEYRTYVWLLVVCDAYTKLGANSINIDKYTGDC